MGRHAEAVCAISGRSRLYIA